MNYQPDLQALAAELAQLIPPWQDAPHAQRLIEAYEAYIEAPHLTDTAMHLAPAAGPRREINNMISITGRQFPTDVHSWNEWFDQRGYCIDANRWIPTGSTACSEALGTPIFFGEQTRPGDY